MPVKQNLFQLFLAATVPTFGMVNVVGQHSALRHTTVIFPARSLRY